MNIDENLDATPASMDDGDPPAVESPCTEDSDMATDHSEPDVLDLLSETAEQITDARIEERLRRTLIRAGYHYPGPPEEAASPQPAAGMHQAACLETGDRPDDNPRPMRGEWAADEFAMLDDLGNDIARVYLRNQLNALATAGDKIAEARSEAAKIIREAREMAEQIEDQAVDDAAKKIRDARDQADRITAEARGEAANIIQKARDDAKQVQADGENLAASYLYVYYSGHGPGQEDSRQAPAVTRYVGGALLCAVSCTAAAGLPELRGGPREVPPDLTQEIWDTVLLGLSDEAHVFRSQGNSNITPHEYANAIRLLARKFMPFEGRSLVPGEAVIGIGKSGLVAALMLDETKRELAGSRPGSTDDVAILNRAREGDQDAWEKLVARYDRLIWAVTRSYRIQASDAADVYRETWMRLFENSDRNMHAGSIGEWLVRTARRECQRCINGKETAYGGPARHIVDHEQDSAGDLLPRLQRKRRHPLAARREASEMEKELKKTQEALRAVRAATLQSLAAQHQDFEEEDVSDLLAALSGSTIRIWEPTTRSSSSWLASAGDDLMLPGHGQADERQDDEGHREEKAAEPAND